jgi:integrase
MIGGDILAVKKTKKRFGPKKGGASAYREMVDALSLEALTPVAIQQWRMARVKKAKNPKKESSAKTSCHSTIRQARSLFAPKVVKFLKELRLPEPTPFAEVEFYEKQNSRYSSTIDVGEIVAAAHSELAKTNSQAFLAFLLAIGAGLRRGEIDGLCWHQVDTRKGIIRVEVTDQAGLKTSDSQGEVDVDEDLCKLLQGFKARAKAKESDFVIQSDGLRLENRGPQSWGQKYRANAVHDALIDWLRNYKQDGQKPLEKVQKPIHELRKELGSLMQQQHGIYAASRALRHSTVATTAAHYVDKKERTTVPIGSFIPPSNLVEMPSTSEPKQTNSKRKSA